MIPKIVVFDLGNVLLSFDWWIAARKIARHAAMSAEEMIRLFSYDSPLLQFELGAMGKEEFIAQARQLTGHTGTADEFAEDFSAIFAPIPEMIDLHAALRRRGVPTYIFSNTNILAVEYVRRHYEFFNHFDGYFLSYEHGAMKPQAPFYEIVERATGRRGAEILYLDDRPENVEGGTARGWQGWMHTAPDATRAFVTRSGLLG